MSMKGLVVTAEGTIRQEEYDSPLYRSVGKTVGGHIEMVRPKYLSQPYCMIVNEDGISLDLPLNHIGCLLYGTQEHGHPILGDVVFLKDGFTNGERDIVGLDEDEVKTLAQELSDMRGEHIDPAWFLKVLFRGSEQ